MYVVLWHYVSYTCLACDHTMRFHLFSQKPSFAVDNAPFKVNPGGTRHDRRPSDHTGDSDNSNSFHHHSDIILTLVEIYIFWDGILKLMAGWDLTNPFSIRIPWVSLEGGEEHRIHTDIYVHNHYFNSQFDQALSWTFIAWWHKTGTNYSIVAQKHLQTFLSRWLL